MTNKDRHTLLAQVAAYTAERVSHYQDARHVMENIGTIAAGPVEDLAYHTSDDLWESGVRVPAGTERQVGSAEGYISYLREIGGAAGESVRVRADILRNYERFAPVIAELKAHANPAADTDSGRLGRGSNSSVYKIEVGGKSYAVRLQRSAGEGAASAVDGHLAAEVLRRSLPEKTRAHLEHIVAASYEDGVTIAEAIEAKGINKLTPEEVAAIPDSHIADFVDTLIVASKNGLEIDPKPSNFLYNPDTGFVLIDQMSAKVAHKMSEDQTPESVIKGVTKALSSIGFFGSDPKPLVTTEDYARDLSYYSADLLLLQRYRSAVAQQFSGEPLGEVLDYIDNEINRIHEYVKQYADPKWVADEIARHEERKKRISQPGYGEDDPDWV